MSLKQAAASALDALEWCEPDADENPRGYKKWCSVMPILREALRPFAVRATYSTRMKCGWSSWRVVDDGHLALEMPAGQCCDMNAAIEIAEFLCPSVWCIDTFSGGRKDTMYVLTANGWEAQE